MKPGLLIAILILVSGYGWATFKVATQRVEERPAETKVIRVGHWQLESGVREAFDVLAAEFANDPGVKARHGNVLVLQEAIPESVYGPWVSTNMVSGKAPDIVQIGLGLPAPIWLSYLNRYFVSLSDLATRPNPFNVGTEWEGVPLKNTYSDSMRNGYVEELQEYMRLPLSRFSMRVFYNKTLLKQLTGLDRPPEDWQSFIRMCESIRGKTNSEGRRVYPIAGSKYHTSMWEGTCANVPTWSFLRVADFNRDGSVGTDEQFVAFRSGQASFETPAIRAKFTIMSELIGQFQTGFTGLTRVEAVMLFAKQQAIFFSSGTWDAGSVIEQAKSAGFEVGLMRFPIPDQADPRYGQLMSGPAYDPSATGFSFGMTRFGKHPEVAREFLLYLSSRRANERLNFLIGWIPVVQGAPAPPLLRGFEPNNQGMWANINFDLGGETVIRYQQLYSLFLTDPAYPIERFFDDFGPFYLEHGLADWQEQQRDWRRAIIDNEKFLAGLRGDALRHAAGEPSDSRWIKYRAYMTSRQVFPEIHHAEQRRLVLAGPTRPVGPYNYLPGALDNVKSALRSNPSPNR
jgi:raffinose/stachyose/melibiose transport system substrate-binding protein